MRVAPRPRFLALVAARRRFPHTRPDAAALALARLVVAEVVHELVQRDSRRGSIRGKRPSAGLLRRRREGSAPAGEKSCGVHIVAFACCASTRVKLLGFVFLPEGGGYSFSNRVFRGKGPPPPWVKIGRFSSLFMFFWSIFDISIENSIILYVKCRK